MSSFLEIGHTSLSISIYIQAVLPLKQKLDDLSTKLAAALPASITGKKAE